MAKKKTNEKPTAPKATKPTPKAVSQTVTNTGKQHVTVGIGPDSIPLPPGATEPLNAGAAEFCKKSPVMRAWIDEGRIVIKNADSGGEDDE